MTVIGQTKWVIPGGCIPFHTTGREPALLSQDKISVLNTNEKDVNLTMTVLYPRAEPIGPYSLTVKARRMRTFRANDLVDPYPIDLEAEYALTIETDAPVVIQYTRMNTGQNEGALMGGIAYPLDF